MEELPSMGRAAAAAVPPLVGAEQVRLGARGAGAGGPGVAQ